MPGDTIAGASAACPETTRLRRCRRRAMPSVRRRRRVDLDPAAPHRRRQRIGHLLQPRQVRQRSVEERARRHTAGSEAETAGVAVELRLGERRAAASARPAPLGVASAAGSVPHQPPFSCASVHASQRRRRQAAPMNDSRRASPRRSRHGRVERLRQRRPTSSSTSAVARV